MTILNTAQSLEIRGLTDTVSGPKDQGDRVASSPKTSPPKDLASPTKDLSKVKRGPHGQHLDNGSERKRSKMDMVNEAQQILDNQTNPKAITAMTDGVTDVKQEFGAVTIERGVKSQTDDDDQNNYNPKQEEVTNMGYDCFDDENDATEYLPQDGIVLQEDDRVST